jgi:hypothetical protein
MVTTTPTSSPSADAPLPVGYAPAPGIPLCRPTALRLTLGAPLTRVAPGSWVKLVATVRNATPEVCAVHPTAEFSGPTCSPVGMIIGPWVSLLPGESTTVPGAWVADVCSPEARSSSPAPPGRYVVTASMGEVGSARVVITVLNETPVPVPSATVGSE